MVGENERVIVLDFGLARSLDELEQWQVTEGDIVGTISYMSPEQAAGKPLSPASDWYSVGVMLFEAVAGRLPFIGRPLEILENKQRVDAPEPRVYCPAIPEDLNSLCVDLLKRNPDDRPSSSLIMRLLGAEVDESRPTPFVPSSQSQPRTFVGRQRELQCLKSAYEKVRNGSPRNLLIRGSSGLGKSAVLRDFLSDISQDPNAVVLLGRCYERQSVPYRALDAAVDSLSFYLSRIAPAKIDAILPVYIGALARVFPAMCRVETVRESVGRTEEIPDQQELRRMACQAFRELLRRIGSRTVLVLAIDDLQWGDTDSALLLAELLREPDAPRMLFVGTYRTEDAESSPLLNILLARDRSDDFAITSWDELSLGPLSPDELKDLVISLVPPNARRHLDISRIVRESRGNPYFAGELVHFLQSGTDIADSERTAEPVNLDLVVLARINLLPTDARRLLEIVAVAGQPIEIRLACAAAKLMPGDLSVVGSLRAAKYVRSHETASHEVVECYHDRIAETIVKNLSSEALRQHHRCLALVLAASERADPLELAIHYEGAGDSARAKDNYCLAAAQAFALLAFNRAAKLYEKAICQAGEHDQQVRNLRVKKADALANAGKGVEASQDYLAAISGASSADTVELLRRATEQSLISGHIDFGLDSLRLLLKSVKITFPRTPLHALLLMLLIRGQLKVRGRRFLQRDESQVPPEDLSKIDTCWSSAVGLANVDPIRSASFSAKGLLLALRAGETFRISRALALEAVCQSISNGKGRRRAERMLQAAEDIAGHGNATYLSGMIDLARGWVGYLGGNFLNSAECLARAESTFRERCTGVAWELDTARIYGMWIMAFDGRFDQLAARLPEFLKDARERGDLYASTTLGASLLVDNCLAADDPQGARREMQNHIDRWSQGHYHVQHFSALIAEIHLSLYIGDCKDIWDKVRKQQRQILKSQLNQVQFIRILTEYTLARCALAAGQTRHAERFVRLSVSKLMAEDASWANPLAHQLLAGLAVWRGQNSYSAAL